MNNYNSGWKPNKRKPPQRQARRSKARIWVLQGTLVLALCTVLWRVYDVQKVYGKQLSKDESRSVDVSHVLLAPRGSILDAQGNKLAYDVPAFYVDIKVDDLKANATAVAQILAPILGTTPNTIVAKLTGSAHWVRWPYPVLEPVKSQLEDAFKHHLWAPDDKKTQWSADITYSPTEQRFYPYGQFAANTLGYVALNSGVGEGGVEYEYNKLLAGYNGTVNFKQDAYGFPLPGSVNVSKQAQPGDSVQLTIDDTVQGYVENEMDSLVQKYQPQHAAIIVTNPQTGAILAMSSRPTYNPNTYWTASDPNALSQNWAVSSVFEPGSTFKPIVLTSALATGSVSLNQTFQSGTTQVAGHTIQDWNYGQGWGTITYQQALERSSNVGFAKIAQALGWPNLLHYMDLFGFLNKTGVDLPNESSSIIFPPSERGTIQLSTAGFGQGIAVTPLQQMAAMGAIANGGKLMKPYITSQIISPDGKTVKKFSPTVVRQNFIPQNVLDAVNQTMVLDVSGKDGIDGVAKIPGYDVAGKTGTAQVVDAQTGQYYSNRFITSFIGYAPASHPVVEVYVTVDWPKAAEANTWGSTIAAPYARDIMKDVLQYDHVPPTGTVKNVATQTAGANKVQYVKTPNIVGLTEQAATAKLKSIGLNNMFAGDSGNVQKQWPAPGIDVAKGSTLYGLLQTGSSGQVAVPNLTGLSLRDATNLLAAMSLKISPTGTGYVTKQTVPSGTKVGSGTTIGVSLQPSPSN
ncbi:penicillin-binding transpeptidase domain-containing protein [Alicyclobacillus dauci]|uniref:Penicillin-binding transpeptidase domain-containing protein n=1 Tax=Alicyclobacillus dauci TaxID=1475485 RepID=A0ABY6YZ45_9BACL|nr:penicillin-binding transpeptidase domain-containing protein [Alicyclobacillus dauci]WAH35538.1 penicillin-binding transpeptidase domain-containing protein [Alicyclobacillus dauci]